MKDERRWRAIVHTAGKYYTVVSGGHSKDVFVRDVASLIIRETEPLPLRDWLNWCQEEPNHPLPINPPNIVMAQTHRRFGDSHTADVVDCRWLTRDVVAHIIANLEEQIQSQLPQRGMQKGT